MSNDNKQVTNKTPAWFTIVYALVVAVGVSLVSGIASNSRAQNDQQAYIRYANCQYLAASSGLHMENLATDSVSCGRIEKDIVGDSARYAFYGKFRQSILKLTPYVGVMAGLQDSVSSKLLAVSDSGTIERN